MASLLGKLTAFFKWYRFGETVIIDPEVSYDWLVLVMNAEPNLFIFYSYRLKLEDSPFLIQTYKVLSLPQLD